MGADSHNHFGWLTLLQILAFLLVPFSLTAQITFERTYGGADLDGAYSIQQTEDRGYIIAGVTWSFGAGSMDVYLVKTDSVGDTIWTRTYGGVDQDLGYCVQQTQDGGYIIVGDTYSFGAGDSDVYLVKADSLGDSVWTRICGGTERDGGYSVQRTQDSGYIVVGETWSFGTGYGDVYLVKTDPLGNAIWTRTYGGIDWDVGYSVQQTKDGGYIIAGVTRSSGAGSMDVYLVKTDSMGGTIWTRTYGGPDEDYGYGVQQTEDGGYIIVGWTRSFGAGSMDVYLVKTDSGGDAIWTRTYGGTDRDAAYSVRQTEDGGYIIAGVTWSFGAGSMDVYLVKTDSVGDTIWTRTYGGIRNDWAECVQQTEDGGYVIAGWTRSFGAGELDVYMVKTDGNGLMGIEEMGGRASMAWQRCELLQNYPNPLDRSTLISYSLSSITQVTLAIYDITGRVVETVVHETQEPGIHQVRWNRRSNPSGVYFYGLRAGEFVETKKMVLVD